MKKQFITYAAAFIFLLVLTKCASVSAPTGGRKDTKAPRLVASYPQNKTTNFKDKVIELEFNEYINADNIKQELLITPEPEGTYNNKTSNMGLTLTFDKPFAPNTTYTFNFRNAIRDITEKNTAKNIKLVFSTGDKIDSLSITGSLKDPLKNLPILDAVIALYRSGDTSNVYDDKPYYSTRTDSSGKYALENLKSGKYLIYAVEDKNGNFKYDKTERIGFRNDTIDLNQSVKGIDMDLVRIDKIPPKVADTQDDDDKYAVTFSEGLQNLQVNIFDPYKDMPYMLTKEKVVTFYNTKNYNDSIPVQFIAADSSGNTLNDTIKIKFETVKAEKKDKKKKDFSVTTTPKSGEEVEKNFEYKIEFSEPVQTAALNQITVLADTITREEIPADSILWNEYKTALRLKLKTEAKREVRISIPAGTFMSIDNDSSKVIKTDHRFKEPENYGSISGKVSTTAENFIIQLLSTDFKIVAELRNKKEYVFNFLPAGNYRIRVVQDDNNNGKWDPGDMAQGILPEKISFYVQEIKLKENWELVDQNLNL